MIAVLQQLVVIVGGIECGEARGGAVAFFVVGVILDRDRRSPLDRVKERLVGRNG